ncbi:MAG TPA: MarR family transcriptional regulator [Allosphingosinicella sp.]|nr:MarR family transcriptional regulator [Allosphingosinicella sp.]
MFPAVLFADPAWDILLDLTISKLEGVRVSVLSLCLAAPVPTTTAFRWIRRMEAKGLLVRTPDEADRRRIYIDLNDQMLATMVAYLDRVAARERATGDSWPC